MTRLLAVACPQRTYLPPYMQLKPSGSPPEAQHGSLPDRPLQPAFASLQNGYHSGSDAGSKNGSRARRRQTHVPWPAWGAQSLATALAACALAADGVPAGWAIARSAVASVADAGRVLLPACLVAAGKGATEAGSKIRYDGFVRLAMGDELNASAHEEQQCCGRARTARCAS